MNLAPVLKQRFFDAAGLPLAGGLVQSYAAGTTTPQATYSNAGGTPNTNPVVLDSTGYADIWLDPALAYKFVVMDSGSNVIFTEDNVTFSTSGIAPWSATAIYSQGSIVQDASGQGLLYVSLANNNQGNALTVVASWRVFQGNIRTVSTSQTSPTLLVTDDLIRSNSTSGNLTHTLPPCSTTPVGKKITVKDIGTGGFTTSVKGSGTDNVDGANTFGIAIIKNQSFEFENNGVSWDSVSGSPLVIAPTIQTFSAGSGTYTLPTSPKKPLYIRFRMAGGGSGGNGGGSTNPAGAQGAQSSFGASYICSPGLPGAANTSSGGGGGGVTSATAGIGLTGGSGTAGSMAVNTGAVANAGMGAAGGSNPLGGGGGGGGYNGGNLSGIAAAASTGAGGGGGCGGSANGAMGGGGGGAGGYLEIIITSPASTYAYTVGAGGAGGSAGTNGGAAGGAGGSGFLLIEEFY